jgi:hypothetical protein
MTGYELDNADVGNCTKERKLNTNKIMINNVGGRGGCTSLRGNKRYRIVLYEREKGLNSF